MRGVRSPSSLNVVPSTATWRQGTQQIIDIALRERPSTMQCFAWLQKRSASVLDRKHCLDWFQCNQLLCQADTSQPGSTSGIPLPCPLAEHSGTLPALSGGTLWHKVKLNLQHFCDWDVLHCPSVCPNNQLPPLDKKTAAHFLRSQGTLLLCACRVVGISWKKNYDETSKRSRKKRHVCAQAYNARH